MFHVHTLNTHSLLSRSITEADHGRLCCCAQPWNEICTEIKDRVVDVFQIDLTLYKTASYYIYICITASAQAMATVIETLSSSFSFSLLISSFQGKAVGSDNVALHTWPWDIINHTYIIVLNDYHINSFPASVFKIRSQPEQPDTQPHTLQYITFEIKVCLKCPCFAFSGINFHGSVCEFKKSEKSFKGQSAQ